MLLLLAIANAIFLRPMCILADFHIVHDTRDNSFRTLPVNKYKCLYVTRFGKITSGNISEDTGFFQVTGNTCGLHTVDFHFRTGGYWEAYKNPGDGEVVATCYNNSMAIGLTCLAFSPPEQVRALPVEEKLLCKSSWCK